MNIEITTRPKFWFKLTLAHVAVLLKLSKRHYDGHCRMASHELSVPDDLPNGFLIGWWNMAAQAPESQISAPWDQLDTALKILECTIGLKDAELKLVAELTFSFRRAMIHWNNQPQPTMLVEQPAPYKEI